MTGLIQKLAEIGKSYFVKKDAILCISLSPCSSIKSEALKRCKDCELYPKPEEEQKQLEKIRAKLMFDISPERELDFLKKLHPDIYKLYKKYNLEKASESFKEESRRCWDKHGCSLIEYYDIDLF